MQRRQHKLMRSRTQHEEDRDIVMQRLRTSSYSPMLENGLPSPQSPAMEIPSKGLFRTKSTPEGLIASEAASSSASGSPDSDNNSQFPKSLPRRTNSRWSMKNCENCHMIFVGEGTCCTQECRLCLELRERPSEVAHLVETALPQQNEAPASGYFSYDVWNVSPQDDDVLQQEFTYTRIAANAASS
mmetsp:Transcript_5159/g.10703  ORF Transcript_5159/g.10703 Transcript_5159/m.10703 type:complete len:186 (+) Transcript_5159:2176-2733(+)|eukprot:CAMPEP_0171500556 /NCGR_PEP_ID=MMETSP0958-20121227/9053_1 /TAXON_ID=87120 /ORGANISM="Aurantiochytrium limacinum, Strain ATCCMYA-1381" /LENGTH=185 /DNA_ID=CAMNT_0012035243 /DNA_START=1736 /DNA_END=2293 /DNA_ORIENTATION=-